MEFLLHNPRSTEPIFNVPMAIETGVAEYHSKKAPIEAEYGFYIFEQKIIPLEGGRQLLRLRKPLLLKINPETLKFTVNDWGIEMDCLQLGNLPREVARQFLKFLHEAENENLSEVDQAYWLRISDYVDFQQFSIERSAPRYMEGIRQGKGDLVIVEWHDGTRETLDRSAAQALTEINPGERFSAFVKLGKNDKTISIERVSLLGPAESTENWESWPTKN